MATHVKIIAALCLVFGAFGVLSALFSSFIFSALAALVGSTNDPDASAGMAVLGLTGITLTIVVLVFSIPYIICGWGLLKLRPWSRILGIILAAISLIRIPFGTIFGIYALIILFNKETEALFQKS
jgi:hypothetical protein